MLSLSPCFKHILLNTVQKEIRNKSIWSLLILTSIVIIVLNALLGLLLQLATEFQAGGAGPSLGTLPLNAFFWLIDIFSTVIAILVGVNSLKSDEENGVNLQLLSFPVKRWEYLLARILGSWGIVVVYYLYSIILAAVLFSISSREFIVGYQVFMALVNTSLIILPTVTIAILFSFFLPKLFAFFFSFFFMLFVTYSNLSVGSVEIGDYLANLSFFKILALPIHYLLPRTGTLSSFTNALLYNVDLPIGSDYFINLAHYVVTIVILISLTGWILKRKDV
ncbi:MAG: ABC transporter permease subunit [Bacteriovoracaceae bacterium]|nr:ABC transporter permease subunit [Bacteriovoracaceae bacterium]